MPPLKVLIVGGGVAGPAFAYWLSRIGASITLIERSPSVRAYGQQIDLRAQGIPLMKKMGIEAAVRAKTIHEPGTQLIDTLGRVKAFFPANQTGSERQGISSDYEIMRGDLVKILYTLTENRPNVQHLFDTTIESLTQDQESDPNGKVHVSFKNGTKQDFDLVVGADGIGSRTRKLMLGPDAPDPRHFMGGYIGFFSIPSQPEDSDRFTMCHLPGSRASRWIATRKDTAPLTRVYMQARTKDDGLAAAHESRDMSQLRKAWSDLFQDGGWQCQRFMEALQTTLEADDLYSTPIAEVRLPEGSWSKGRVVLLGDAAHSATANGIGTTWALVGSYVLAGEIASLIKKEGDSITKAIVQATKSYEQKFRPIATASHGGSEFFESLLAPRSSWGISILHAFAGLLAYFKVNPGEGLDAKTAKWELPAYPELEDSELLADVA